MSKFINLLSVEIFCRPVVRIALRSEKVLQRNSSLYKLDKLMTLDSVILKIYPKE